MTRAQKTALERYISEAQQTLNLGQWKIELEDSPCEDDALAEIEVSENLWQARIRVAYGFFKEKPEEQRDTIVHELIHVHTAGIERSRDRMEKTLGELAWPVFQASMENEVERAVDALAKIVAPTLPIPEFPA
jgi:hypothetical protein